MHALSDNPIHCVVCNLEVELSRLQLPPESLQALAYWNMLYRCVYQLWLDAGEYKSWAEAVLMDLNTQLNRDGLALAGELGCSYWGFQQLLPEQPCPGCGARLKPITSSVLPQLFCADCGLIFAVGPAPWNAPEPGAFREKSRPDD